MEIARYLGFVEGAGETRAAVAEDGSESDRAFAPDVQEKYFLLLLVHLYENWFLIDRPNRALENLVLFFKDREAVWVGDGMLPAMIAGIGASDASADSVNPSEYLRQMAMHEGLGNYVRAAIGHEAFGRPAL
jgi:hypothetical protein